MKIPLKARKSIEEYRKILDEKLMKMPEKYWKVIPAATLILIILCLCKVFL